MGAHDTRGEGGSQDLRGIGDVPRANQRRGEAGGADVGSNGAELCFKASKLSF